ncbi:MAG TPA: YbhB/YbcL family Raf kinase inhibitor-like protein [Bryobacteraceae bacterium]|nr:YbhB/YbcL family Raf kinase inhibitor-like protein [Bryobacteraceae bacterium]
MRVASTVLITLSCAALAFAQGAPPASGRGAGRGGPRLQFSVTSNAFPDGGIIPMLNAGRGDNKSPDFEFHWDLGTNPTSTPDTVKTYAVILHDVENSSNKTTTDTLHWSAFNIPGAAKGLPAALGTGDLPDGTRNGPGIMASRGTPGYFGPGAPAGPIHHYIFEFYALDTKLDLPANTTRDELLKAMDGHVVGKAAYTGRFPGPGE